METDSDRIMRAVAKDMDRPYLRAPLGIWFGTPGAEVDDPYFGGKGPRRTGCIGCNDCSNGCRFNAKNKTTVNYLYLAEAAGAVVHPLQGRDGRSEGRPGARAASDLQGPRSGGRGRGDAARRHVLMTPGQHPARGADDGP